MRPFRIHPRIPRVDARRIVTVAVASIRLFLTLAAAVLVGRAQAQCGIGWTLGAGDGPGGYEICYDEARARTVLVAGPSTYEWDGVSWEVVASGGPPERGAAALVYDPAGERCLLFGGYSSQGARKDLWSWDGTSWTQLASAPAEAAGRGDFAMAFDRNRGKLVVHGGWPGSGSLLTDTLEWDAATNTWQRWPTGAIGFRYAHRMAFDEARGEIILHGGYYFGNKNDTWRWNGSSWSLASTTGPARYVFGMAYDSARGQIVLHGGTTCCGEVEYPQTWTWNGSSWTQCPVQGPARGYMNIAYDRARDAFVLPGGMGPTPAGRAYVPETWELAMSVPPTTLAVPADYATIQAAVDAAANGDTVLVAPGIYEESVDLRGKAILVKSEVVRGARVLAPEGARSFTAVNGETAKTRVVGFRIGRSGKWGGGVRVAGSSPVFDTCTIEGCRNNTGGGAIVEGGAPAFIGCHFRDCWIDGAGGGPYGGGGAIRSVGGSVVVERSVIERCYGSQGDIMMQEGGGSSAIRRSTLVGAEGVSGSWIYNAPGSSFTIEDCQFDSLEGVVLFGWSPYTVRRTTFRDITGARVMEMRSGQTLVEDCSFERCVVDGFLFGVIYSGTYALSGSTFCASSQPYFQGAWTDLGGNDFDTYCSCFGDIDGDGIVGGSDLAVVLNGWQSGPGFTDGDLNGDGEANGQDLALVLANWGVCPQ